MKVLKITHSFENFTLDIDYIDLQKGKIVGLIGENGAGKTTIMNIISGFLQSNGIFDSENLYRDKILYIPTDLSAYPFLTVSEFLDLIIKYNDTDTSKEELLNLLDLKKKENSLIIDLSQGMSKKLSLVPIFVREYDLLILDEPFNSIDVNYIFELKKYIKELSKKCCILVSSHIIDTLYNLCTDFYVIKNGKISKRLYENSTIEELEREIVNGIS